MANFFNEETKKAMIMEAKVLLLIPLVVGILWEWCLYIQAPAPWILPFFAMTALNIIFLYVQCTAGFSTQGIYARMLMNFLGFIYVSFIITVLFLTGFTTPENTSSIAMLPYTYAVSTTYCCIFRLFLMLIILALRSAGAGV